MKQVPGLSVILATDRYETIRPVVEHLHAQSARDRIEVVVVALRGEQLDLTAAELQGFAGVRLVEFDSLTSLGAARAAGVEAAAAPVVFLGETHTYPAPDWAHALIHAHEDSWAAVVPEIGNANPGGALSWAAFLLDYGRWSDGERREIDIAPAYNAAIKRELLLASREQLQELLEPGADLAGALRAGGHRFLLEPDARIEHLNVSMPRHWLYERVVAGRLVAARRSEGWSRARRLLYSACSPVVVPLLLIRIRRNVRAAARRQPLPKLSYPALALGAAAWAFGELMGYAAGASVQAERRLVEYELHKTAYVAEAE